MSKIVIFNENKTAGYLNDTTAKNFVEYLSPKYEIIIYNCETEKGLDYLVRNKDNRIYSKVLKYCEENEVNYLFIPILYNPEYLYIELKFLQIHSIRFHTKISFGIDWRLTAISNPRSSTIFELLNFPSIYRMIVHSNLGEDSTYSGEYFKDYFKNHEKIKKIYIPKYADITPISQNIVRKRYNLPENNFIILFFGAMYYGKGIDILLEAMKKVNRDISLFISAGENRINFDLDEKLFNNSNIYWNKNDASQEELSYIFSCPDVVVLPYRKTYKDAGSSVLVQACQALKLLIVPNLTPYQEVVSQYNIGEIFESENIDSLAKTINNMKEHYYEYNVKTKFLEYINKIQSWEEYANLII